MERSEGGAGADAAAGGGSGGAAGGSAGVDAASGGGAGGSSWSCSPSKPCAGGELCHYYDQACGTGQKTGVCSPTTQGCEPSLGPVCTCNGSVEPDACAAYAKGLDLDLTGKCAAPAGTFRCGTTFCAIGTQYCRVWLSDMLGFADSFSCQGLPTACSACDCITAKCGGFQCTADAAGNLRVECP